MHTEDTTAHESIMAIEVLPLPLPPSADPSKFKDFGREVKGIHPGRLTDEEFKEIEQLLYKVCNFDPPCATSLIHQSASMTRCSSETSISHPRNSTNLRRYTRYNQDETRHKYLTTTPSPSRLLIPGAIPIVTATTRPRRIQSQSCIHTSRRSLESPRSS